MNDQVPTPMPQVAVLIPCYNEAPTIAKVVADFKHSLPSAIIYVYDNNSTDDTACIAREAGAVVRYEDRQGKGHAIRRMFADIDADVYVLVDGDDTYDASSAQLLVKTVLAEQLDMVVGIRQSQDPEAYRQGHRFGNRVLTSFVCKLFASPCKDILTGYRAVSRRLAKTFPALSKGFEIETELTVHALELRMPICHISTPYGKRDEGSHSKLSTYRDGIRILWTIIVLFGAERPLVFFSSIAILLATLSTALAVPIVLTYMETGFVPRFPTAILATGIMLSALLSFFSGLVLETVTRGRREAKRVAYLAIGGLQATSQSTLGKTI